MSTLDLSKTLAGKNILLIGSTGFVGKVALSMLLDRYPEIGRVYVVVRPGAGNTAEDRFFTRVVTSPAFNPLRERHGAEFLAFMRSKCVPVAGDIGRPLANFTDDDFEMFQRDGGLDVIVNSAGLVSFTPSLESAIRINTLGARNVQDAAQKAGAALVHVSTCFVCGKRNGAIWEDDRILGYFPRHDDLRDDDFDPVAEFTDCQRTIEQVRARASDRAHISEFREQAAALMESEGRDPDDHSTLRLQVARQRKIWVHTRLTELGMERAAHWGWTNTYTYAKALGEQLIVTNSEVPTAIVRPAVVESSLSYPFPGWNEGFNTTAPLSYLAAKGHRNLVAKEGVYLDIIPVDLIAAGMISVMGAVIDRTHEPVYQMGTSGDNPVTAKRLGELIGLAVRRERREKVKQGENPLLNRIKARMEPVIVTPEQFDRGGAPRIKRAADRLNALIDEHLPRWGAPRMHAMAERAQEELVKVSDFTGKAGELIELFKPFTWDWNPVFRCDNMRALFDRMTPADQQKLPWNPEQIDWRHYWLETHYPGLKKYVFPVLDDEFGVKPRSVYMYKDLMELFDATCKLHRHRLAFRLLRTSDDDAEPDVWTYGRVHETALKVGAALCERGIQSDDRVMIVAENRPEWPISYFGILKADAVAVPVDSEASLAEVQNLLRASGAKVLVVSAKVAERLTNMPVAEHDDAETSAEVMESLQGLLGNGVVVTQFAELVSGPASSAVAAAPKRRGDRTASIIYTSGTTGDPKGVMLTHKNLTSMVSKMSSIFRLYKHDGLLSVLPMHHTFEFSAGLLMPLVRGAQITYLDELTPDSLSDAFGAGNITGMVGVPALWMALHRKIYKPVAERGLIAQRLFDSVVELNRNLRDAVPYGWNLGRFLFFPVHGKLGGRMRLLISGGSALSDDINKAFQGLGFQLFEGYGMTESSPVITVQRPGDKQRVGSVGRPLPGVDVKIDDPDDKGVGEVLARGPNVMRGYFNNEAATNAAIVDGWLRTGDLGRLDDDSFLYIVGRSKEMILGPSGENVYPDELEELYRDSDYVNELSIVGLTQQGGAETVSCLVVPDYEAHEQLDRAEVREKVREHFRIVSARLPMYKRVKVLHLWEHELPKTATRKVKRREVLAELERLERAVGSANSPGKADAGAAPTENNWVLDVIAQVTQRPRAQVKPSARLEELGFDSLMYTEFAVALEAAGLEVPDPAEVNDLETVADVEAFVASRPRRQVRKRSRVVADDGAADAEELHVPEPVARLGRRALRWGQRSLYERVFDTRVTGQAFVPPFGGYIAVANHASHLDMGLVKHALGEQGDQLVALAAKDYFFDDPVRRAYFENFTNLVPMERHGSLRESLRLASEVIKEGYILLIFPEGTRSESGVMIDFKPSIGYLAMQNRCGILPMYLAGTHDAMPKGALLPKQRDIAAHVGPFLDFRAVQRVAGTSSRSERYRNIAVHLERTVRNLVPEQYLWTLGDSGRQAVADVVEAEERA